jgi:hypothetical protein
VKKRTGKPASTKEQRPGNVPADATERGSGQGSATALARLQNIEKRKANLRPGRDEDPGGSWR